MPQPRTVKATPTIPSRLIPRLGPVNAKEPVDAVTTWLVGEEVPPVTAVLGDVVVVATVGLVVVGAIVVVVVEIVVEVVVEVVAVESHGKDGYVVATTEEHSGSVWEPKRAAPTTRSSASSMMPTVQMYPAACWAAVGGHG